MIRKKAPAKKPAAKKAASKAKSTVAKKTATAPATKRTTRKAVPAKKAVGKRTVRKPVGDAPAKRPYNRTYDMTPHGYTVGSDSAILAEALVTGGKDRGDIAAKALKQMPNKTTRNGEQKNVPSLVSAMITKLEEKGYKIESSFRLIPPKSVQKVLDKQ